MQLFDWLQDTPLALLVGESWFPWVESTHVEFPAALGGTISTVDARLLDFASRHLRFSYLAGRLLPWTWAAFFGAVPAGVLLFMANAVGYLEMTLSRSRWACCWLPGSTCSGSSSSRTARSPNGMLPGRHRPRAPPARFRCSAGSA